MMPEQWDLPQLLMAEIQKQQRETEGQLNALSSLVNDPGWKLFQSAMKELSEACFNAAGKAQTPHQMATQLGNALAFKLAATWPEQMVEHLRAQLGGEQLR